jgi:hypothetical protein
VFVLQLIHGQARCGCQRQGSWACVKRSLLLQVSCLQSKNGKRLWTPS